MENMAKLKNFGESRFGTWTDASKQLPNENVDVLCIVQTKDGHKFIDTLSRSRCEPSNIENWIAESFWWGEESSFGKDEITHWMPMPATEIDPNFHYRFGIEYLLQVMYDAALDLEAYYGMSEKGSLPPRSDKNTKPGDPPRSLITLRRWLHHPDVDLKKIGLPTYIRPRMEELTARITDVTGDSNHG